MKALIVFPPMSMEDSSDEPLIIEAVMEGYLVRRVYVDQGASIEVMFKHCFENLSPAMRSRLRSTQMDLVVRAPSPYNVILGRTGLKTLREVSSTIHSMVKFPTPRGIATLVTRTMIISECRRIEKMIDNNTRREIQSEDEGKERVYLAEQVLVNPSYPDQYTKEDHRACPQRQCIKRTGCTKKENHSNRQKPSVIKEVEEWLKTEIIRPVRYPTRISNPVLVKKGDRSWRMCIDFKNLNSACSKDYYPLPDIDGKIKSVAGFQYKFLDRSMDSDKYLEGQSMQRPPLFESDSFIYWKNRFETYVKSKDLDLWHVITNGDFQPIIQNPETKLDEVVPFENQTDDLKRRLAKNNEAKMVIYNALPRKEYERIFMCNTAKEIWKTLLITHQGNNQVKDNKIDLLVQQYEQFVISEDESIDSAFARFNTIITSLKALDEGYSSKNYVRKFLRALHPKWEYLRP
ncbi:hypothetical protein Tco_1029724 [Tanacetum coccineum]|uniref:DUF4219 domain-containing protein/UBN2 domain-containing protein n=1 Tax=Tanacetum coccineum TaxID=301880 RepID=A0ABQ5G486_9ASTR